MATEDGSVKIKVDLDITDVGSGVKDIGTQLKKAGDAAAQAGRSMGKNLSRSSWGYDKGAVEFMENFGKAMEKDAKAAAEVIKYYDQQDVSAENAAKSVRMLAEEEAKAAAKAGEVLGDDGTADTIGRQVQSAEKALAEMSGQGLGPGDAKWDEAYQALAYLKKEEKAYLADLAKTPEEREREAEAIAKAAAREEELRQKEEARAEAVRKREEAAAAKAAAREEELRQKEETRAEAVRKREEAEAAEAQRLEEIAQSAQVGSKAVVSLTQELEQLQARQQELNAAGVGMGYAEYDANAERIRAATAALREYAATGSDAQARTLVPDQSAWERFRQKILGAAASLGLVRKQTNDTTGAMKRLRSSAGTAASGVGSVFKKVLKWGLGIRSTFILVRKLRNAVKEGLSIMAQHDTETANTLNSLKTALTNVKLSLATAFGPVVTAVAPLLIKLSNLVARAADAVARFFAILTGKSTYKKAVAAQDAITDSVAGTGAAAKEAAKNLSGLDELNIWQENKGGSGGGGSSGADVDMEEVETGAATDFEVRLRDILFQWDDLNPELIAEKILTGLCAAAGGIIGYTLGGTLGGLVGLTLGALLGVKLSQVTFDGDGTINPEEGVKLIVGAVLGLLGGVAGAVIGGPAGAVIGFAIGAGVSVLLSKALFNNDGKLDGEETSKLIITAVLGLLGFVLGAAAGVGGIIGFAIGAGVSLLIGKALFNNDGTLDKEETTKLVVTAVLGLLGGALGAVVGGPLGAAIGFSLGAGVSVLVNKTLFNGDGKVDDVEGKVLAVLGGMIGGALGFMIGGPLGAAIGFAVGAAITVALSGAVMEKGADLKEWVKEKVVGLVQKAVDAYHAVVEFGAKVVNNAKEWWSNVKEWWSEKVGAVKEFSTSVANGAKEWWSNVKEWWSGKVGAVKEFSTSVANGAKDWWSNVKEWWSGKVGAVKEFSTSVANGAKDWWSNVKDWWSGKVGAVKEFSTNVANGAKDWWSNVKDWWSGKVGSVQSFTTAVANGAATWWSNVKEWWKGKVGSVQSFKTAVVNGAVTWWSNVKSWWKGKVGSVQSFKTAVANNATTWWSNVKKWWKGKVGSVQSFKTSVTNGAATWWKNVKDWWSTKSKDGVTFKAKVTSFVDAIKDKTLTFKAKISEIVSSAKQKVKDWLGLATGGIYKNGQWQPIKGYAAGGSPRRARLFYANENGMPELIGRIGSSTAVMNNGQIVASVAAGVYQAVAAAMGQMGGWFRAMSAQLGDIPPAIELLANMPAQAPQPVMATGTVLPPKAVYAAEEAAELTAAVRELHDMLTGPGSRGGETPIVVNVQLDGQVDRKTLFTAVATEARIQRRASGKDPFAG